MALGTPQNIDATNGLYNDKVYITWDAVTTATAYSILRSDSAAGSYVTLSSWISTTSFYDSTTTLLERYWYKVQARDSVTATDSALSDPDEGYAFGYLNQIISKNKAKVFRRLLLKRKVNAVYETDWQEIPNKYIINFGNMGADISDIKSNFLSYRAMSFKVNNDDGYFSDIDESRSFFYETDGIYRTLVKVEAGYIDTAGTEYPSETSLFVGLIGEDIRITEKNEITFKSKHISSVLDEIPAMHVAGLGTSLTASEIMTLISNHTDGAGEIIFQNYISAAGWNITVTTVYYDIQSSTSLQGKSCWQLIRLIAEAENMIAYIDRSGDFYFTNKTPTTAVTYHFHGLGDSENQYGHNVKSLVSIDKGLREVFNRVLVKYDTPDTLASYVINEESWTWGDSSSSYLYGVRDYKYNNTFIPNSAIAEIVADNIYTEFKNPKEKIKINTKFIPQLKINDRVSFTYKTRIFEDKDKLWGVAYWNVDTWGKRRGYNVNYNGEYKITGINHNVDNFFSSFTLKEI